MILRPGPPTPELDRKADELAVWGARYEEQERIRNIPVIAADQTPEKIFEILRS